MPPVVAPLPVLVEALRSYDGFRCPGCGGVAAAAAEVPWWPAAAGRGRYLLCKGCSDRKRTDAGFRAELGVRLLGLFGVRGEGRSVRAQDPDVAPAGGVDLAE